MNALARVAVPEIVVTATAATPAACAGETAVNVVSLVTVTDGDTVPPNCTVVAPGMKLVPVTVVATPPTVLPAAGATSVTVGGSGTPQPDGVVAGVGDVQAPRGARASAPTRIRGPGAGTDAVGASRITGSADHEQAAVGRVAVKSDIPALVMTYRLPSGSTATSRAAPAEPASVDTTPLAVIFRTPRVADSVT